MREGWLDTTLGDVVHINPKEPRPASDDPFVPMDPVTPGDRWVTPTQSVNGRSGARFRGGDILFARITPCLENGKIAQVAPDVGLCGGSTEFIVLRAGDLVLPTFLYYLATGSDLHSRAVSLMIGTTGRQRISAKDLAALPIVLPPLEQQARITDLLGAISDVYDAAKERARQAERLRRTASEALLGGELELPDTYSQFLAPESYAELH